MNALTLAPLLAGLPLLTAPWARWRVSLLYRARHGRWPDLDAPARFTEWVQWRKLYDRRAGLARLTDKAYGKVVASALLDADLLIPTLWLGARLPAIAPWPMPFIVKANHGCGQFVVVRTCADYLRARLLAPLWLARPYGGLLDEWHCGAARRLLLVEPYVGGAELPLDYKVYVFGGRAAMVQLHTGRGKDHRWTQYDRDWAPLSDDPVAVPSPAPLAEMLVAAETMAGAKDFLRVDFYCEDGALRFGEYCLYPGSGLDRFRPDALDLMLGRRWREARGQAGRG